VAWKCGWWVGGTGDVGLELIGPSRVRALPLGVAAERSVHYIWYYFSFCLLCHILFYDILHRVLGHQKNKIFLLAGVRSL
jgi:hypothetical protein